jgi:branched-chain amino acid transport system ATP-binding protein
MAEPLLSLQGVHTHIGRYHILQGVDLAVPRGGFTVLLGRNGAGKTTTLRTVMGLWKASRGSIRFDGHDFTARPVPDIASAGIAYVPENMSIFAGLTVRENLLLAARAGELDRKRRLAGGALSGGQKQMLAIARALIEPRELILVDEPTKGLAPAIVGNMIRAFQEVKRAGATVLLVEQNFMAARLLGDTVAVMDDGRIVHHGSMAALAADSDLQRRLLGLHLDGHQ